MGRNLVGKGLTALRNEERKKASSFFFLEQNKRQRVSATPEETSAARGDLATRAGFRLGSRRGVAAVNALNTVSMHSQRAAQNSTTSVAPGRSMSSSSSASVQTRMVQFLDANIRTSAAPGRPVFDFKEIDDLLSMEPKEQNSETIKEWVHKLAQFFIKTDVSSTPVEFQQPIATSYPRRPNRGAYSGIPYWHELKGDFASRIHMVTQSADTNCPRRYNFSHLLLGATVPGINDCMLWSFIPHKFIHDSDLLRNVAPSHFTKTIRQHLSICLLADIQKSEEIHIALWLRKFGEKENSSRHIARRGITTPESPMEKEMWMTEDELKILCCVMDCNVVFFRTSRSSNGTFNLLPHMAIYTESTRWVPMLEGFSHFGALGVPQVHRQQFDELIQDWFVYYNSQDNIAGVYFEHQLVSSVREWWQDIQTLLSSSGCLVCLSINYLIS